MAPRSMPGLRRNPVYFFGSSGRLRIDGTLLLDVGLFRVKPPDQVTETWDYYKQIRTDCRGGCVSDTAARRLSVDALTAPSWTNGFACVLI